MVNWIEQESEQLELEAQENMGKGGHVQYWKAPEGETVIEVMTEYSAVDSKFKDKKELHILIDGTEVIWTISRKSPLYRDLIRALKEGKKKFKLLRMGMEADDTRYKLTAL